MIKVSDDFKIDSLGKIEYALSDGSVLTEQSISSILLLAILIETEKHTELLTNLIDSIGVGVGAGGGGRAARGAY